jgi:hypothetical protein
MLNVPEFAALWLESMLATASGDARYIVADVGFDERVVSLVLLASIAFGKYGTVMVDDDTRRRTETDANHELMDVSWPCTPVSTFFRITSKLSR